MCRIKVRESSLISLSCSGNTFCELVPRPGNTHGGADKFVRVASGPLPSFQNYRPYVIFSSPMRKYEHPLRLTYFLFMAGYRNLYTSVFFHDNLLILYTSRNICHSIHRDKLHSCNYSYFLFPVKPFCWCYLAPTLNLQSSSLVFRHQLSYYVTINRKVEPYRDVSSTLSHISV